MMSPGTVFVPPYRKFRDGLPVVVYHGLDNATVRSLSIPSMSNTVQLVAVPTRKDASTVSSSLSPSARTLDFGAVVDDMRTNQNINQIMTEDGPATARASLSAGLVDRAVVAVAPMTFIEQYHSGISSAVLENAGLSLLGSYHRSEKRLLCCGRSQKEKEDGYETWLGMEIVYLICYLCFCVFEDV